MREARHEPVIVGFLCHWCAYRAADLVGMMRTPYASNVRPIRVMCSSRVDPEMVLKAFFEGADGVLIFGCRLGECHYVEGNLRELRRVYLLRAMLEQAGVASERLQIVWAAASDGDVVAATVDQMTERLRELGPLRWPALPPASADSRSAAVVPAGQR